MRAATTELSAELIVAMSRHQARGSGWQWSPRGASHIVIEHGDGVVRG